MGMKVERFGPWDKVMMIANEIQHDLPDIMVEEVNKVAEDGESALKQVITGGRAGGPSLSPVTVQRKGRSTKLFENGDMAEAVTFEAMSKNKEGFLGIGKKPMPGSGLTADQLASIHEFGNATIPARPFMKPAMERLLAVLATRLYQRFSTYVNRLGG